MSSLAQMEKTIVTASDDGTPKLWSLQGKLKSELHGHLSSVYEASFSADGKTIITASADTTTRLWDLNGSQRLKLQHQDWVLSASLSADEHTLVSASNDSIVHVWETQNDRFSFQSPRRG